ncbi:MAG: P27 family phage terminase small subunit [Candidatus Binataceae bacterium]
MRGPKPIPTQLKRLRGNPGKRRLNDQEPVAQPLTAVPSPPRYLNGRARAFWRASTKELLPLGLLARLDLPVLAAFCAAAGQAAEASHRLKDAKLTPKERVHWLFIQSMAWKGMKSFGPELGIGASSRSRLKVAKPEKVDPFEEFLRTGKAQTPDPDQPVQ